jgi:outer membrane protein TolC
MNGTGTTGTGTNGTSPELSPNSGTGSSPGTLNSPSTGGGNSNGGGTSLPGTSNPAAPSVTGTSYNLMPMPLILQNYVTESTAPQVVAETTQSVNVRTADTVTPSASSKGTSAKTASSEHALQSTGTSGTSTTTTSTTTSQVIGDDKVNNYGARINLSQYIDAFGLLGAAKDAEKLNRDFYALDIDRNQNEVALSAKNLFFNVILAEQQVATDEEQVADSTEDVRVTTALVQQGQAAGFDLLSVQTTLANNRQLLTSARNQLSFAVADLDYLLGINPETPIQLAPPALPSLTQTVDLAQSTAVALQRRPEIIQANKNIAMAQKLLKVASEGTTPAIGLVGTYGYNSTSTLTGPTNEGLLSAQIQIPFDDGGATRSRVREAKDVLQSEVITRDELKLSIALEVRQAYLNVLDGQTQATTAQTGVDLAVETLRVARVQYANGVGTILDEENAEAQLATARTNLANAQYTYQTALASLVRAIGSR